MHAINPKIKFGYQPEKTETMKCTGQVLSLLRWWQESEATEKWSGSSKIDWSISCKEFVDDDTQFGKCRKVTFSSNSIGETKNATVSRSISITKTRLPADLELNTELMRGELAVIAGLVPQEEPEKMKQNATAVAMWSLWKRGIDIFDSVKTSKGNIWESRRSVHGAGASESSVLSLGNTYLIVPASQSFASSLTDIPPTSNMGFDCVTSVPLDVSLVDIPSLSGEEIHTLNVFNSDVQLAVEDYIMTAPNSFSSDAEKDSFVAWLQRKTSAVSSLTAENVMPVNSSLYL